MEDKKITMPAVALRGLTILPGMVQHFDISREKSIRAIETAMMGNQKVYLCILCFHVTTFHLKLQHRHQHFLR